jgi:hypothetical protein
VEPEDQRRLETHFQRLTDAELRRITALEREQYRDDAFALAIAESARRHLPLLKPEEYWAGFRQEWLEQVSFCYQCWVTTTDEPLGGGISRGLVGTRVEEQGDPCPICHSVLASKAFCIVFPIMRQAQYRVLFDRRLAPDPPRGRRLREGPTNSPRVTP